MAISATTLSILSIKQIGNYQPKKNADLKGQACLLIECPYDEDLVDEIKDGIENWRQREWTGTAWAILKDDPNQQADQETNLEFVRRIAQECCDRRGWMLADYTAHSQAEIAQAKQQTEAELLEAHVAAILAVLPKLPPYSLRLSRWGTTLKFQLARYLSDDEGGYDLFMELKRACVDAWKPSLIVMGDAKMHSGFVFEMSDDPRIIRALMQCRGVEYLKVFQLQMVESFGDGTAHLVDADGSLWLGCDYSQVDMSQIDFDSQAWKVAEVDGVIYWVDRASDFVNAWLLDSPYSILFRVFFPKHSRIASLIEEFHLEQWFQQWAQSLLAITDVSIPYNSSDPVSKCRSHFWSHPADILIDHIKRFSGYGGETVQELIGLSPDVFQARCLEIDGLKQAKAAENLADVRARARAIVASSLEAKHDKAALLKLAEKQNVQVKKTWTKSKVAEAIATQEYAENYLGLDR